MANTPHLPAMAHPASPITRRALLGGALATLAHPAHADDAPLALLADGSHLAIMRHALAPGTGDPAAFRIDDCTTQRNLSDQGRAQATQIGTRLRAAGITRARVLTSQWCRARDTARLLGYGPPDDLALLNSFFATRSGGPAQTRALRTWIAAAILDTPVLLVSHQVVVTALSEVFPASGEIVILRRHPTGALAVAGRVPTPP